MSITWQGDFCCCDEIEDFERGILPWIIWMAPVCSGCSGRPRRGKDGNRSLRGEEAPPRWCGRQATGPQAKAIPRSWKRQRCGFSPRASRTDGNPSSSCLDFQSPKLSTTITTGFGPLSLWCSVVAAKASTALFAPCDPYEAII